MLSSTTNTIRNIILINANACLAESFILTFAAVRTLIIKTNSPNAQFNAHVTINIEVSCLFLHRNINNTILSTSIAKTNINAIIEYTEANCNNHSGHCSFV